MSVSQAIPSKINTSETVEIVSGPQGSWPPTSEWSQSHYNKIYITAVMYAGIVFIDGSEADLSAMSLASPISCKKFVAGLGQIAYYIQ